MGEEMKGTTRYLDATVMEYALLDHARLRTPYGTQDDVRAYAAGGESTSPNPETFRPPSAGPTAGRMGDWYRGVEERFAAMSEENRRTRAIEPDEEAYHVGTGMYVTAEQFADVLPSPLLANRFVIMSFGYDADQASLHWNDMDYWSDEAAETAITDGDEDGCYWTGCMWDEDDYPDRLETPGMEESARPGGKTI